MKIKSLISQFINFIFSPFKIQDNKIIFETGRDLIDGNPKAIYDYIKNNNKHEFRTIWAVSRKTDISMLEKKDFVYYKTIKYFFHMSTAKYWIRSQSIGSIIKKKENQIYIQTWHGNGPMKKMGYDLAINENVCINHIDEWDYYIAMNELDDKVIRSSTRYNKQSLILGSACTDTILQRSKNKKYCKGIREKLNIKQNKKIVLYAPTFREEDLEKDVVDLNLLSLKEIEDYIFLIRLHPLIKDKVNKNIFDDSFIDVCNYPDASEILAITDILISDYSSIIYEYAVLNRPIIFYAYDINKYQKERGFYIDYYNDLPGPIVYSEEELYDLIKNIDKIEKQYKKKIQQFNKRFNKLNDGNVSKRIVEKIINHEFE